jgi:hypothetical protein
MPSTLRAERILASKRWAAMAAIGLVGAAMWIDWAVSSSAAASNARLAEQVTRYAKENRERMKQSEGVLQTVQQMAPQLAAFDVVGANQGFNHAVLAGVAGTVAQIAATSEFRPPAPTLPALVETTPPLQGAYLRKIELPEMAGADPFKPLAAERTVTVLIDIPAGGRQSDVRQALLKQLRELPVPAHLQDLTKSATLFRDVQATSDIEGQVDWYYLDRDRIDEKGDLKPVEERKTLPTSVTTFTCIIAAAGAAPVAEGEAKP